MVLVPVEDLDLFQGARGQHVARIGNGLQRRQRLIHGHRAGPGDLAENEDPVACHAFHEDGNLDVAEAALVFPGEFVPDVVGGPAGGADALQQGRVDLAVRGDGKQPGLTPGSVGDGLLQLRDMR